MIRHAEAIWEGSITEGKGSLSTQSDILNHTPYSFKSRFEDGKGTNPEELIAAAHAGCFSMQLSAFLTEEGYTPESLKTKGEITLKDGVVTNSHLTLVAKIPEISQEKFDNLVEKAEKNCPISKLLSTEISVDASLVQ
jgi:osmotically inducible protein OsmC